jgi:hypothetical protein
VPDVISVLIENLLEKEPDKRPQSAREVRATLDGDPAAATLVPASGMMSPFRDMAQAPRPVNTPAPVMTPTPASGPHVAPKSPVTGTTETRAVPSKRGALVAAGAVAVVAVVVMLAVVLSAGDRSDKDACNAGDADKCAAVAATLEMSDTDGANEYYTMACDKGHTASCRRADELACSAAKTGGTIADWQRYLDAHPKGSCAPEAQAHLEPPPPPPPLEAMRAAASRAHGASDAELAPLLAEMTRALHELSPELTWEPTSLTVLSDTSSASAINAALAREGAIVYLQPGRYVLAESIVLDGVENAVLASDGGAVLVSAGEPAIRVAESQNVLMFGFYVTRISPALIDPRGRRAPPYLMTLDGSSAINARRLEYECNGGGGLLARNSTLRLDHTVIYHCGAPALSVDSGEARAEDLAIFDAGADAATVVTIGKDAVVAIDQLTLVAPAAGARAKGLDISGALTLSHALIVHGGRALYRHSRTSELTLSDSCFTAAALDRGIEGSNVLLSQSLKAKPAGQAGWYRYALETSATCRSFGAHMPTQLVPKRSRPN